MSVTAAWRKKDQLLAKFRRMAPAADEELTKANSGTAGEMVALAQSFVPVRSGALRDSIVATPPGGMPPAHSQGGGAVPAGAYMVTAGNDKVRYGHLVEFGTADHIAGGKFAGAEISGAPRQAFFFPAYRLIRKRHKGRASRALGKAIKRVIGGQR